MALTGYPDTDTYLIRLFTPRDLIYFGMINKEANKLVQSSPIYMELTRLKFDKHLYQFHSYDIIKWYYKHGMINLITQHHFDHHRAVYLAAKFGHLDLIKFIYQTVSNHFPLAKYNFYNVILMTDVVKIAFSRKQYHIIKWLEEVSIIDNYLAPIKILCAECSSVDQYLFYSHAIEHASETGNLTLLRDLMKRVPLSSFGRCWREKLILVKAFAYGHVDILNWMVTEEHLIGALVDNLVDNLVDKITTDFPDKQTINEVLDWFWLHQKKFIVEWHFKLRSICLSTQLDILAQVYPLFSDSNMLTTIMYDVIPIGNLDILQWLWQKTHMRTIINKNIIRIMNSTVKHNQLHILAWLTSVINPVVCHTFIADFPIIKGNIPMLEWFQRNDVAIYYTTNAIIRSVYHGYGHVIKWLHDHELLPHIHKQIVQSAIEGGHINILQWIGESRIKELALNYDVKYLFIEAAFTNNRTDILELFQSYQLIDDEIITRLSAMFPFRDDDYHPSLSDIYTSVRWLKDQYRMFDLKYVWNKAVELDYWHIVEWILDYYPETNRDLCEELSHKLGHYLQYRINLLKN